MGVFVVLVEPTLIHVEAPPSVMGNIEAGRRRGAAPGQDAQPEVAFSRRRSQSHELPLLRGLRRLRGKQVDGHGLTTGAFQGAYEMRQQVLAGE
jgi:hypothetical protein